MGEQMHGWILYILSVKWTNKANFVRWFHPFWIGAVSIPHHLHHHQLCKLSTHLFAPIAQTCPHKYTYIHIYKIPPNLLQLAVTLVSEWCISVRTDERQIYTYFHENFTPIVLSFRQFIKLCAERFVNNLLVSFSLW